MKNLIQTNKLGDTLNREVSGGRLRAERCLQAFFMADGRKGGE